MKSLFKTLAVVLSLGALWIAARYLEPFFMDSDMPGTHAPKELFEILRECDRLELFKLKDPFGRLASEVSAQLEEPSFDWMGERFPYSARRIVSGAEKEELVRAITRGLDSQRKNEKRLIATLSREYALRASSMGRELTLVFEFTCERVNYSLGSALNNSWVNTRGHAREVFERLLVGEG